MKWDFKTIVAILAVGLFVLNMVAIGVLGGGQLPFFQEEEQQTLGQVQFNGSIRTYDPYLVVPGGMDSSLMNDLKSMDGVKEITAEQGNTVIFLETRDEVYPTALYLKGLNITAYSLANIASPGIVPVILETGEEINASFSVPIRIETTPLVPPDTIVNIAMLVLVSDNTVINYGSAYILTEEKTITLEGEIQKEMFSYSYNIPWEQRNNISKEQFESYGDVYYQKNNIGFFERELTQQEMLDAKQFDYIEYIDKRSAVFSEEFADYGKVSSDLNVNVSFSPSMLSILTNETMNLTYDGSLSYIYTVKMDPGEYNIDENTQTVNLQSSRKISEDEVLLSLTGKFIGNMLFELETVAILEEQ